MANNAKCKVEVFIARGENQVRSLISPKRGKISEPVGSHCYRCALKILYIYHGGRHRNALVPVVKSLSILDVFDSQRRRVGLFPPGFLMHPSKEI